MGDQKKKLKKKKQKKAGPKPKKSQRLSKIRGIAVKPKRTKR